MMRKYKKYVIGCDHDEYRVYGENFPSGADPIGIRKARKRVKEFLQEGTVIYELVPVKEK